MTSIASAVARFKDNPQFHLNHRTVWQACDDVGYTWRDRQLDPVTTIQLFIAQVLHGNVACRTLRHVAGLTCSAAAYCKARARLPLDVFGLIVQQVTHAARETTNDIGRWRGHRLFYVDGTGVSMPDTPALAQAFGYPGSVKPGCGFPVMHGLFLFDAATGLIVDLVFSHGHTHDAAVATRVHPSLEPGDVLLGDRAFDSFTHLAWLIDEGIEALCRVHQRRIVDFKQGRASRSRSHRQHVAGRPASRQIRRLGHEDQWVEYRRDSACPVWLAADQFAELPASIVVRELCYRVTRRGYRTHTVTLVTTLLDPVKYPKQELVALCGQRWEAETNLRYLKQTMGMDVLRCKTPDGVLKELWMYVLVYNLVCLLMLAAAKQQDVKPNRISFIDALDCLRYAAPTAALPPLVVNPLRSGRHEPRVIKRRKDRYTVMTQPRERLRQALGISAVTA